MKTRLIPQTIIVLSVALIFYSCQKEKVNEPDSEAVNKYLEIKTRMNATNASSGQMNDFMSVIGNSRMASGSLSMEGFSNDSSYFDSIRIDTTDYWNYYTCAKVTETDNGDGTFTTVYDYGDGCEEWGNTVRGKITYIWNSDGSSYSSMVIYEGYYSYGMEMNGFSEYSFTSDGDSYFEIKPLEEKDDTGVTYAIPVWYWSGNSSGKEDITVNFDSGEEYTYTSSFSNKWTNNSYIVLSGDYYYKNPTQGYEYNYVVNTPLVSNFECENTWVPVSGSEYTKYYENGVTTSFSVNYGDGECDNLAMITMNGETTVVDFGELIYKYSEDTVTIGTPGRGKK